jgi:hypothetical protein
MADIDGVAITEITGFGCSDDGKQIWLTHKLRDGSEYRLVYPHNAAGHLITLFSHAARSASELRHAANPAEAAAGLDSDVISIEETRVGTLPGNDGAILHLTTSDNVPIAVALPGPLLASLIEQLRQVGDSLHAAVAAARHRLH